MTDDILRLDDKKPAKKACKEEASSKEISNKKRKSTKK